MAQRQIRLRLGPPQIQIAEAQPGFLRRVDLIFNLKWRRFGIVQNVQPGGVHFDFARS